MQVLPLAPTSFSPCGAPLLAPRATPCTVPALLPAIKFAAYWTRDSHPTTQDTTRKGERLLLNPLNPSDPSDQHLDLSPAAPSSADIPSPAADPRPASSAASVPNGRRGHRPGRILGIVTTVLLALAAIGFGIYRYLTRDIGQSTVTGGVLTATPSGLYFRNTAETIAFVAPAGWSRYPTSSAQIMVRGNGCSFGLLEQRTNLSVPAFANAEARDLKRRHPEANPIVAPRTVAGKDGLAFTGAYTDSQGGPMSQTYILVDRGPTVITVIETATDPACAQAFASLEDSLHL